MIYQEFKRKYTEVTRQMQDYFEMHYELEPDERIFPITKSFLHHEMERGCKKSGVKKIRIHDLRHSHVSLLIDMGFSAVAIAERVGHESIDITYRYAHLFPSKQLDMVNKLENKNRMMEGYSDVTEEDMEIAKSSSVVSFQKYFSRIG